MPAQISFPSSDVLEQINADRRQIILIIKSLVENDQNTLSQILQRLNYSKLPTNDYRDKGKSKVVMTRLIRCAEGTITSDSISKIKYKDLLVAFKTRFPDHPKNIDIDITKINKNHDNYYIYYYEAYSGLTEKDQVRFGVVGLNLDRATNEWETGTLYYLNEFSVYKEFEINRVKPPKNNSNILFFTAIAEDQVNFFTLLINNRGTNSRGIIPLTYSVLETQKRFPSAGLALLEKIENNKFEDKIKSLKEGINEKIINVLYQRKNVLEGFVYESIEEFTNDSIKSIEKVAHFWSGVYFRLDFKDKIDSDQTGGMCKFVLRIERSGICKMYWQENGGEYKSYSGVVEFPYGSSGFMKIYLEFLKKEKTYRKYIFLSRVKATEEEFLYSGVTTGWASKDKLIYTSPVYIQKIDGFNVENQTDLDKVLYQEKPQRISKKQKRDIEKIDPKFLEVIKGIENEVFSSINNCIEENAESKYPEIFYLDGVDVYSTRENPKLKKRFLDALEESTDILAIGIGNNKLADEQSFDFYDNLIERNGKIRIMFLDPKGVEIGKREIAEGWDKEWLTQSVNHNIKNMTRFKNSVAEKWPIRKDNIQWLCYDFQPMMNAIIIDKKIAIVHYYYRNDRGADVPTLLVKKESGKILTFFMEEVEKIWTSLANNKY